MALFSSFWSVSGVSPEAREAALRAASSQGVELGIWLSEVIRSVNAEELRSGEAQSQAADAVRTKLTSIERAMLRAGPREFTGNLGPA